MPQLENFIRDGIVTKRPVPISILREKDVRNYPYKVLRELMMNSLLCKCLHKMSYVKFHIMSSSATNNKKCYCESKRCA